MTVVIKDQVRWGTTISDATFTEADKNPPPKSGKEETVIDVDLSGTKPPRPWYEISCRKVMETRSTYTLRSHTCGELRKRHIGQRVELYGWLTYKRMKGKFMVIRDAYGTTQLIMNDEVSILPGGCGGGSN